MSLEMAKLLKDYEGFVKCTRINCLFNTHCTMQCTHDIDQTSPSGECKFYVVRSMHEHRY